MISVSSLLINTAFTLATAATAYLIYRSVSCLIQIKRRWWCKALLFLMCWISMNMIIFMGDLANLPPTFIAFLLCVWLSCEGSGLKRITIGLMFASTIFAFNGFNDNVIADIIFRTYQQYSDWLSVENCIMRGLFAVILYFGIHHHRPERDFELSQELWKLLLMLTVPSLGIVVSLILLRSPFSLNGGTMLADAVLFVVAILSFAGLLRAVLVLERQQKLERESQLAKQNQKYYETMEQQQFEIRRLKHDLSNHLQALLALPEEKRTAYIEGMLDNPAFAQILNYSGDATVNAVLTSKETMMRQKGIAFYAKVDIQEELPFEKADICALFANALDNAVEACEALPEEKREVRLEARMGKGMLAVCIKNRYLEAQGNIPDNGRNAKIPDVFPGGEEREKALRKPVLGTTKKDAANHGFGLRSIREVVKKYDGNIEIEREAGEFTLFLYLPLGY